MHEMAIVDGIIEIVTQHAGASKVIAVDVEIGELSSVVPEALEFCFEACTKETRLDSAALNIIIIAAIGECAVCGKSFPIATLFDSCTNCGSFKVAVISGEEMRVSGIDIED